jgi:hypothetical protein
MRNTDRVKAPKVKARFIGPMLLLRTRNSTVFLMMALLDRFPALM